jgi:hypothetical protein
MIASTVARGWAISLLLLVDCHSSPPQIAPREEAGSPADAHAQVQLTWRLFETMHSLDEHGQDRASAVYELLVNGGTPARVSLGRRSAVGCVVHDAADRTGDPASMASLECHAFGHGEYARVQRSSPVSLRVEAFGQDEAPPGSDRPRSSPTIATVTIPADAEVLVEPTLMTVPDETPGP